MFTVIETPTFSRQWPDYWSEDERGEFVAWLAVNPDVGDVSGSWWMPQSQMVTTGKGVRDTIEPKVLKKIQEAING